MVMRMVEDFSLLSESDSDEDAAEKAPEAPVPEPEFLFTPPPAPVFSKPSSFQFDDRRLKSKCQISEEDLLLREMMSRYEKLEKGKAEEENSTKFTDPALNCLVTRVRRESKIFRLIQNKYRKLKRQDKGKILSRCNYAVASSESEEKLPYSSIILGEESPTFTRLKKPSEEDILLARKINKINTENLASTCSAKPELSSKMTLDPDITKTNCETEQRDSLSDSGIDDTANTSTDSSQTKMETEEVLSVNLVDNTKHETGDKIVNELDSVSCHRPLSTNILQEHIQDVNSEALTHGTDETNLQRTSSVKSPISIPEGTETICHLDDDQFDVEVSFCDNMDVLEENNQTYLILETDENCLEEVRSQEGHGEKLINLDSQVNVSQISTKSSEIDKLSDEKTVKSKVQSESAENLEDIQKFLLDSETDTLEDQKSTGVKPQKSSKSSEGLYSKESALKIISQSSFFIKNNVKNELKASKVQTFEDALNAATAPSKRPIKSIQVKSSKDNRVAHKKSKPSLSSSVKSSQPLPKRSSPENSPKKSPQLEQKKHVDVVSKIMAEQSKSFSVEPKMPNKKPDNGSLKSTSKSLNISSTVTSKKETTNDISSFPLKEPTYEEIYSSLKKTIFKDTTTMPFDQIIPKSLPRTETQARPPLTTETLSPLTIESPRPRAILPKPVPSHIDLGGTRGLSRDPVKTEVRSRVQTSHGPHMSPVKRGEASQGYYTSPVKVSLI